MGSPAKDPFGKLDEPSVGQGKVAQLAREIREHADSGRIDPATLRKQVTLAIMHGMATSVQSNDSDALDWIKLLANVSGLTKATDQATIDPSEHDKRKELERLAEEQNAPKR